MKKINIQAHQIVTMKNHQQMLEHKQEWSPALEKDWVGFYQDWMQQQQEMSSVQQWHISYLVIMGRNLYTNMSFQIY